MGRTACSFAIPTFKRVNPTTRAYIHVALYLHDLHAPTSSNLKIQTTSPNPSQKENRLSQVVHLYPGLCPCCAQLTAPIDPARVTRVWVESVKFVTRRPATRKSASQARRIRLRHPPRPTRARTTRETHSGLYVYRNPLEQRGLFFDRLLTHTRCLSSATRGEL